MTSVIARLPLSQPQPAESTLGEPMPKPGAKVKRRQVWNAFDDADRLRRLADLAESRAWELSARFKAQHDAEKGAEDAAPPR